MAVTAVEELTKHTERKGRFTRETRSYRRTYRVTIDDVTDTDVTILTASHGGTTIPVLGAAHPDDGTAKAIQVSIAKCEDRLVWIVVVEYERPAADAPAADPLDDRVQIIWDFIAYAEALYWDKDGAAILNSAHDRFDPSPMIDRHYPQVTIIRNEATFDPSKAEDYMDSVNSDSCTIAGLSISPRQGKVVQYGGPSALRNGVEYYRITYRLEFNPKVWSDGQGWDRRELDQGLYKLDGGAAAEIMVGDMPTRDVQLLDGSGGVLGEASTPVFRTFRARKERPFALLGLNI